MNKIRKYTETHHAKNLFSAWPANNGIWSWGSEILVGLTRGPYHEAAGHNIIEPFESLLCRSINGGKSWTLETTQHYVQTQDQATRLKKTLNFTSDQLAIRVRGAGYHHNTDSTGSLFISYDRGRNWQGPYIINGLESMSELKGLNFTARTDYIPLSNTQAYFFISVRPEEDWAKEKVCCIETQDGGLSFQFKSWIVPTDNPYRAVMPATVQVSQNHFISALRRRNMEEDICWIDLYESTDNCETWQFIKNMGSTGSQNGNPPALLKHSSGKLFLAYGNRDENQMLLFESNDHGKSWSDKMIVRDNFKMDSFKDADFGYPRLTENATQEVLLFYYWATEERYEQHIALTVIET
ncbi:MAG: glycoside hydrolase [Lentisphaeria bacterium]|nr:glycoside hydrolase [Lentisphaeria bacterium]